MRIVDALDALLAEIELIAAAAECPVDTFRVTAGEPAAPSGYCSQLAVWASQSFNAANSLFHEDSPCLTVRGVQLHWRLDLCYSEPESGKPRTPAEDLDLAACLYGLGEDIWCGLNLLLGSGFLGSRCGDIAADALTFTPPFGGIVSAGSGIRLQLECPPGPSS